MEKDKKRILLIVPMLDQGGLERVCATTAQLLKKEYVVCLVVFNTAGMIYDVSGVDLVDLNLGAVEGKLGKLVNVLKRVKRVRRLKKERRIQLSYSFGPTANLVNILSREGDCIWTGVRGFGALQDKASMKRTCRLSDRVISCTKVMEEQIQTQFHPKKSAVIYNPCALEQIKALAAEQTPKAFDAFFEKSGPIVVSMGREHDVKGFWHLIKAVYLAKRTIPNLRLMIIGAGAFTEYKALVGALGMQTDVLFTGVLTNPFALLKKADVYALTSESEGFPNALIEAMAVGLPCISVNCLTGPAEILHENYRQCADQNRTIQADYGILTPIFYGAKDLDATHFTQEERRFSDALTALLLDKARYRELQAAAVKRAKLFSVKEYFDNLRTLIETDLKENR